MQNIYIQATEGANLLSLQNLRFCCFGKYKKKEHYFFDALPITHLSLKIRTNKYSWYAREISVENGTLSKLVTHLEVQDADQSYVSALTIKSPHLKYLHCWPFCKVFLDTPFLETLYWEPKLYVFLEQKPQLSHLTRLHIAACYNSNSAPRRTFVSFTGNNLL